MRTLHPTQIGTIESGFSQTQASQIVLGRDVSIPDTSTTPEGYGFGIAGRPDFIEKLVINLTYNESSDKTINQNLAKVAQLSFDATGLAYIINRSAHAPSNFNFVLKEVLVCENQQTRNMIILASETYETGLRSA